MRKFSWSQVKQRFQSWLQARLLGGFRGRVGFHGWEQR